MKPVARPAGPEERRRIAILNTGVFLLLSNNVLDVDSTVLAPVSGNDSGYDQCTPREMNYGQFTVTTFRHGYRNIVGLVLVSLLAGLALVPFAATTVVGTIPALLGGLWTTCLLLGVVTVAAFRFTSVVAERGVNIVVLPHIAAGVRNPVPGFAIGVVTFTLVLVAVVLTSAFPEPYQPIAIGFAGFMLVTWYLLTAFAAPELGNGQRFVPAMRASVGRVGRAPHRVAWFMFVSFTCALVAGMTVVTLVLFLPGVLALLAARASIDESGENNDDGDG